MSGVITESNVAMTDKKLNEMILEGKALEAFDELYADDVVMQENANEPVAGKEANRKREEQFFGSIGEVHAIELKDSVAGDDKSYSEWVFDVTFKDGNRKRLEQVSARSWKDGKVQRERFYYNEG